MNFFGGWKEQNLITREHIFGILEARLQIVPHRLPEGAVGQLYVIDGIAKSADAIMDFLEERAIYEKEKIKRLAEESK